MLRCLQENGLEQSLKPETHPRDRSLSSKGKRTLSKGGQCCHHTVQCKCHRVRQRSATCLLWETRGCTKVCSFPAKTLNLDETARKTWRKTNGGAACKATQILQKGAAVSSPGRKTSAAQVCVCQTGTAGGRGSPEGEIRLLDDCKIDGQVCRAFS